MVPFAVELDPRIDAAILAYSRGLAPLKMSEVAPLPVTFSDGTTKPFGDLTPDEIEACAGSIRARAEQQLAAALADAA